MTCMPRSSGTPRGRATSSSTRAGRPAIATPCPGPIDIEPCMASAVNGIRGRPGLPATPDKRRVQPQRRADELLRVLVRRHHHRQPREPLPAARRCRGRGRSSSTTRTTAALTGFARARPRRLDLGGIPSTTLVAMPLGSARRLRRPVHRDRRPHRGRPAEGGRELQRRVPEAHDASRRSEQGASCSRRADDHGTAGARPPITASVRGAPRVGHRAAPTPTTGGSAGRSSTRCAAAPTRRRSLPVRAGRTPASTAPTAPGATACRSSG